jgi:hypothetical protein
VPAVNQILQQHPNVMMSSLETGCSEAQVHTDFDPTVRDRAYLEKLRHQAYETAQNYSWQNIAATTPVLYEEARHFKKVMQNFIPIE